jgi:hypothetical protein
MIAGGSGVVQDYSAGEVLSTGRGRSTTGSFSSATGRLQDYIERHLISAKAPPNQRKSA